MTKTAQTVFIFGIYMIAEGVALSLMPNVVLALAGLPETTEVWIRLVGMTLIILGYYYIRAARTGFTEFFKWTIHMRTAQFLAVLMFVALGFMQPAILIFSLVEFTSGIWTWTTLHFQSKAHG